MNKLTVLFILFTLFHCGECVPISCVGKKSLRFSVADPGFPSRGGGETTPKEGGGGGVDLLFDQFFS